jgi:hypothetical protein
MSPAQHGRYWRDWGKIRKMLVEMGDFSKADADAERKQIHIQALGRDKSSKDLTNKDLDKIFEHFASYLVLINGPKDASAVSQPVKRLIWAIDQLGLPEPYLESISRDMFGTSEWRKLPEDQLTKFRFTATVRSRARRKASKANEPF